MRKMEYKWIVPFTILAFILVLVNCVAALRPRAPPLCNRCRELTHPCCYSEKQVDAVGQGICCDGNVIDNIQGTQFSALNPNSTPVSGPKGKPGPYLNHQSPWSLKYWNYESFITAAARYQPYGFGTTYTQGGLVYLGKMEVAALLAHIGSKVTCDNDWYDRRPVTCGLCYYKEENTGFPYCNDSKDYPCARGVAYYGRGALPIYWNYNYGEAARDLKVDLLNHPEYIEKNATLAFLVAIWRWMTPIKEKQPSAHDVFTGNWKPTEDDKLAKRVSGFGTTINVLYGDLVCGKGNKETSMNNIIEYYLHYLDRIGVNRTETGSYESLSCADQVPFNPSVALSP